ncbi:MAG: discoidin domain-containing protein [Dehalococcoidia bacterium]
MREIRQAKMAISLSTMRVWLPLVALAAGTAFALLSCGDDGAEQPVSPIEEILDGDILIEDIGSDSANVRVVTTIPVVCAVVFGSDESYGRISTDPDMGGAAHTDHFAPLRGLEPDTLYHYRLQGTGPDGTLYASDDLTFRTAAGDPAQTARGPNLASVAEGASVREASSVFGGSAAWQAENAIDGDPLSEWSSNGDGDDAFITVELPDETQLTAVGLWSRTMGTSAEITQFQVVTDRGETLGPFALDNANRLYTFDVSAVARWLRFEVVSSSGGNTGAVEITVYGETAR